MTFMFENLSVPMITPMSKVNIDVKEPMTVWFDAEVNLNASIAKIL